MDRQQRIDRIVGHCLGLVADGRTFDVDEILRDHADLCPELEEELRAFAPDHWPPADELESGSAEPEHSVAVCIEPAELATWIEDGLPATSRELIARHLASCPACREELRDQQRFSAVLERAEWKAIVAPEPPSFEIPGHEYVRPIGGGAQGIVWQCRHTRLDELRAVKIVTAAAGSLASPDRILSEARILGMLRRHPHRILLHDCIVNQPRVAFVMEYVPGASLSERLGEAGPLDWETACRYIGDIADGLADVHGNGVLHRDIKPGNILIHGETDEAVLCDFGLAVIAGGQHVAAGTPGYLAPELLTSGPNEKSDVFSLAATLFHLVTGAAPFDTQRVHLSLRQAAAGIDPACLTRQKVPAAVGEVILAALQPDSDSRLSLADFIERLRSAHLRTLGDSIRLLTRQSQARVQVGVSIAKSAGQPARFLKDIGPDSDDGLRGVEADTGNVVVLDASASLAGYLTVLNLASNGDLDIVYPQSERDDNAISSDRHHTLKIRLEPPAGTDCLAFIWTKDRRFHSPEDWKQQFEARPVTERGHAATRALQLLAHDVQETAADGWAVTLIELRHRPAGKLAATVRSAGQPSIPAGTDEIELFVSYPPALSREEPACVELFSGSGDDEPVAGAIAITRQSLNDMQAALCVPGCQVRDSFRSLSADADEARHTFELSRNPKSRASKAQGFVLLTRTQCVVPYGEIAFPVDFVSKSSASMNCRNTCDGVTSRLYRKTSVCCADADRDRVVERLKQAGMVNECRDLEHTSSERWQRGLHRRFDDADLVLVCWSQWLLADSWALEEAYYARRLAMDGGPRVFPLRLEEPDVKRIPKNVARLLNVEHPALLQPLHGAP